MLNYSSAFRAALDKRIRNLGHCLVNMTWPNSSTTVTIDDHIINNVKLIDEVDPLCRSLPIHTCEVSVFDFNGTYSPGNPNSSFSSFKPFTMFIQFQIESDTGTLIDGPRYIYKVYEVPKWRNYIATFKGTRIESYFNEEFYEFYGLREKDAYDVASTLAKDKIASATIRFVQFRVPSATAFPVTSRINCLQLLTGACGTTLAFTYEGNVTVKDYTAVQDSGLKVQEKDMFSYPVMDYDLPTVANEIVNMYDSSPVSSGKVEVCKLQKRYSTLTRVTEVLDVDGIAVDEYPTITATNATDVSVNLYARKAEITLTPTSILEDVVVAVSAMQCKPSAIPSVYLVDVDGNESETVDNPVCGASVASNVAYYRSNYLKNLSHAYAVDYRGNPAIEPLDIISVELPIIGLKKCLVTRTEFSFDGAFKGKLYVKRIDSLSTTSAVAGKAIAGLAVSGSQ
nr:MAG TPA: hypothetical protein [Caudoviricetes sp.]